MDARRTLLGMLVVFLVILGLGSIVWWTQQPGRETGRVQQLGNQGSVLGPDLPRSGGVNNTPSADPERQTAAAPDPSIDPAYLGTITVEDESGTEYSRESGHLVLRSLDAASKRVRVTTLSVAEGRWDPGATPLVDYSVQSVQLGGRRAVLAGDSPSTLRAQIPHALRARWLASASIHVVDDSTGTELDDVTLYWMDTLSSTEVEIPLELRSAHLLGDRMRSPIDLAPLPEQSMTATLFAHRRGYAWGKLAFDRFGGGDQTIRLLPGADLAVSLGGADATADMTVRLWRGARVEQRLLAERTVSELPKNSRSVLLPGLAIGVYEISLERGETAIAVPVDRQTVRIEREGTVPVHLVIPSTGGDAITSVRLAVKIDPTWDLNSFSVTMKDLDLPANQPGQTKRFRSSGMTRVDSSTWESSVFETRCGRYEVYLRDARLGVECFVIPSDDVQVVSLDVPPCGIVGITVIDALTGQLVERPSLCWSAINNAGRSSGTGCSGISAVGVGRLEFRAPAGKAELSVSPGTLAPYLTDFRTVDITSGVQEFLVELRPAAVISIELREGDRRVEWSPDVMSKILFRRQSETTSPSKTMIGTRDGFLTCFLSEAGSYTVVLPKIPGYMPPADFEIDVALGESIHRIVEITRQQ